MTDLLRQVEDYIVARKLLRRGERMLVAVSGGVDSMVLLHILSQLAPRWQWHLRVAHFNHCLRGRSSDADERFVRAACARLKLPFSCGRGNVKACARREKESLEMAGRRLRFQFLADVAREHQVPTTALAHHADDQVELFFVRLLRGAGPEGLTGMKALRPSPASSRRAGERRRPGMWPGSQLVRPLLTATRNQIEAFAKQERIRFREDASNQTLDFLRNRVRHELLPLLERKYQPGLRRTTLRLMEILEAESEVLAQSADTWLKKRRPAFERLSVALQRRCVQAQLFEMGVVADFELVEKLRLHPQRPISLDFQVGVRRSLRGAIEAIAFAPEAFDSTVSRVELGRRTKKETFGGAAISWKLQPSKKGFAAARRTRTGVEWFDADKVGSMVWLRHWRPGDRFQPIGLPSRAKLQDLFTNQKIPRAERRQLLVATRADGEIWWVEGLRMAEQFKLTASTTRQLEWRWRRVAK